MNPKVSIIIPIYNVEEYLEECLISVQNQTLNEIQVICVNDASTDNSATIAKKYLQQDSRFTLIELPENKGLSFARNRGVEKATGKYLYFLDSDDYIELNAMELLYNCAEENRVQGIFFGADVHHENKEYIKEEINYTNCRTVASGRELFIEVNEKNEYQSASCMQFWLKSYIDEKKFRFYEGILYEDTLYTLQVLLKADRVLCINEKLYHYRKREGSITANQGSRQLKSYMIVYYEVFKLWMMLEDQSDIWKGIEKRLEVFHRRIHAAIGHLGEVPVIEFCEPACQYLYTKISQMKPKNQYVRRLEKCDMEYLNGFSNIFVYGDGVIADEVMRLLEELKTNIIGVVVTHKTFEKKLFHNYPVYELKEIERYRKNALIVLAIPEKYHSEVAAVAIEKGFQCFSVL